VTTDYLGQLPQMRAAKPLLFFHRTDFARAATILSAGFQNELLADEKRGVLLSNLPFDENEWMDNGTTIAVFLKCIESDIECFEVTESGQLRRTWILPAQLLKSLGSYELVTQEQADLLVGSRRFQPLRKRSAAHKSLVAAARRRARDRWMLLTSRTFETGLRGPSPRVYCWGRPSGLYRLWANKGSG
jgi:hypothetical protein